MANLKAIFPSMNVPVETGGTGTFQASWFYLLQAFFNRTGGQSGIDAAALKVEADDTALIAASNQRSSGVSIPNPIVVTPGASPYTYQAPFAGAVVINGGTVSVIAFSRDHATFFTYPAGIVPVEAGDLVKVTYSSVPTLTMIGAAQ